MEAFIIYLAKASGLIAVFFLAYIALLKKETFFTQNRFFLLSGLLTSALLPFVFFTKIVWVEAQPAIAIQQIDFSDLTAVSPQQEAFTINWFYVAIVAYAAGVLFFLAHFVKDLYKVTQMLRQEDPYSKDGFKYIDSDTVQSPFSFFKYIVYNSAILQTQELTDIIAHEKVHSSQKHSVDILISQLFCIAFWFNPVIWLYKKAISQNLEFIADAEATKSVSDKKAYQKTLLKITMQPECIAITNHFYQSLIKKRIVMLNKQQSKRRNFYKYALVAPALVAFVALFQVEVLAQEKEPETTVKTSAKTAKLTDLRVIMDITKNTKEEDLAEETALFKQEFNADVTFTNIKRNAKGEITAIKVTVKDKDNQESYPVYEVTSDDDEPIQNFTVDIRKDSVTGKNVINFGQSQAKIIITQQLTKNANDKDSDTIYKIQHALNNDQKPDPSRILYIIDGVPQKPDSENITNLDSKNIESIDVFKNDPSLIKLYGKQAEYGVIRITTKEKNNGFKTSHTSTITTSTQTPAVYVTSSSPTTFSTQSQNGVKTQNTYSYATTYTANNQEDVINNLLESTTVDYKKAYILINGKEATAEDLEKVNPKKVNLTTIAPGNEKILIKYGDKAANGIITVDLKGYKSEKLHLINAGTDRKNIVEDKDNTGYIIHKKSSKSDIKFYVQQLKEMGINAKISGIDRNKQNEIIAIKIKLDDVKEGDDFTTSYSNDKGITDIFLGRKNGKAVAYAK